jgi:hypothetical protein
MKQKYTACRLVGTQCVITTQRRDKMIESNNSGLLERLSPRRWSIEWLLLAAMAIGAANIWAGSPNAVQSSNQTTHRILIEGELAAAMVRGVQRLNLEDVSLKTGQRTAGYVEHRLDLEWRDSSGRVRVVNGFRLTADEGQRLGIIDKDGARSERQTLPIRFMLPTDPDAADKDAKFEAAMKSTALTRNFAVCSPVSQCNLIAIPELWPGPGQSTSTLEIARLSVFASMGLLALMLLVRALGVVGKPR